MHYPLPAGINRDYDYEADFERLSMNDFLEKISSGNVFDPAFCNLHINYWTFDKMKAMLEEAGFTLVFRSKWSASVWEDMKDMEKFDTTWPRMSLYVEDVKE